MSGGVSTIIAFVQRSYGHRLHALYRLIGFSRKFERIDFRHGFHDRFQTRSVVYRKQKYNTLRRELHVIPVRVRRPGPHVPFRRTYQQVIGRMRRDEIEETLFPLPASYLLDALHTDRAYRRKTDNRFAADAMSRFYGAARR